jgi:hypothetical protein
MITFDPSNETYVRNVMLAAPVGAGFSLLIFEFIISMEGVSE